ncbi:hypothetical protein Tco_0166222 [Tanacetum coccineum]
MYHSKISNDNHKLFNNHNRNHDSKYHNHQQKITVEAYEWRKDPQWIWTRTTRSKSRPISVHVGHVKKKFCYIMQDFNNSTIHDARTKNMLTGKWTRINGDCQKFNAIYKYLEHKSVENEADHIETAKINFAA